MHLSELASMVGGQLVGGDHFLTASAPIPAVCSRGQLFVALRGPNFDGHDYLAAAQSRGAAGALVERRVIRHCRPSRWRTACSRWGVSASSGGSVARRA